LFVNTAITNEDEKATMLAVSQIDDRKRRQVGNIYKLLQKPRATGSAVSAVAGEAMPASFTNWCYTKMAR